MMPIVDPGAELAEDGLSLEAYLSAAGRFHVLRMVSVQSPQSSGKAIEGVQHLHSVATTRGSGGLPNAVVAYSNLNDAKTLSTILSGDSAQRVCGVHFKPSYQSDSRLATKDSNAIVESDFSIAPLQSCLTLLCQHQLSLDLSLTVDELFLASLIAEHFPSLKIVVNLLDWSALIGIDQSAHLRKLISQCGSHENIYFKLCASASASANDNDNPSEDSNSNDARASSEAKLHAMLEMLIEAVGHQRLMFSTSARIEGSALTFEAQWNAFLSVSAALRARQREALFRTNAQQVYRL